MKRIVLILITIALALPSVAMAQVWPNEPPGATVIMDCPFNSVSGCGILDAYQSSVIVQDASGTVSPPNAVFSKLSAGASSGGMQLNYSFATSREVYVGKTWRTNSAFGGIPQGNKLFFMRGPGTNGVFKFSDTSLSGGSGPMVFQQNTGGLDNSHACSYELGATCYPNVGSGTLSVGQWTKLEAYIKCSTTNTSRDGVVRWWINGVLVGNYTNLNYCAAGLNEWVWSETWDGTISPPAVEWSHYVDHLRISVSTCPPGGCVVNPPPPPPPPPPPSGGGTYTFSSQFSGAQGQNQWSYRDTDGNLLAYNSTGVKWEGDQTYLAIWPTGFVHGYTGTKKGAVARWTSPGAGTITINGTARLYENPASGTFSIKHNATTVFSQIMDVGVSYPYSLNRTVAQGDTVDFIINGTSALTNNNSQLDPVIVFTPSGVSIPAPTISGFTPSSGDVGTTVAISGANFAVSVSGNVVKFNGMPAVCTGASTSIVTCNVPQGATTGNITVATSSGTGTSAGTFTVTTPVPTRTVKVYFSHSGLNTAKNQESMDHFNVYRATSIAGSYSKIGEAEATARVYVDTSAPLGKSCYKFEAVDTANNVGSLSTAVCAYDGVSPDADAINPEAPFSVVPVYQ